LEHGKSPYQRPGVEFDVGYDVCDRVQTSAHLATSDHFGDQPQSVREHFQLEAGHGTVHLVGHILEALHGIWASDGGGESVTHPDLAVGPFTVIGRLDPLPEYPDR